MVRIRGALRKRIKAHRAKRAYESKIYKKAYDEAYKKSRKGILTARAKREALMKAKAATRKRTWGSTIMEVSKRGEQFRRGMVGEPPIGARRKKKRDALKSFIG